MRCSPFPGEDFSHHAVANGALESLAIDCEGDRVPTRSTEESDLERRMNRLAVERGALFDKAGSTFGLSTTDQQRLSTVERELDECFALRRQHRAARNIQRFARDGIPRRPRRPV